jgi:hypothetical protein
MPASSTRSYLDRLSGTHASLQEILEAARMDAVEGRDVLDELERVVRVRGASRYLEARDSGNREGLREALKSTDAESTAVSSS